VAHLKRDLNFTIENFVLYSNDYFKSHLLRNRLYIVVDKIGDLAKFEVLAYHFEVVVGSSKLRKERKKSIVCYNTTDESFCFHNKNIDEMRCKLDSTEIPRSFEEYPTPP